MSNEKFNLIEKRLKNCWNEDYYIHKAIAGWLIALSFLVGGIVGCLLTSL